jgi:hypothetical protein
MYILDSASSSSYQQFTKTKGDGRIILRVSSSLSPIPLVYLCNKSPTRPQTQRKKNSRLNSPSQQLLPLFSIPSPSSEPRSSLPLLHHRKLFLEASAILHNQPAILHDGIADPSHNSELPHKLLTHSLQPPCKPPSTSLLSQINQASHSRVQ